MNGSRPTGVFYSNNGYPYTVYNGFMGYFDGYTHPPLNHGYIAAPINNQETPYWSMNMSSYRSEFSDSGTSLYYDHQVNDPLPRTEINRRTWEYSPSVHIEERTTDMQSEENIVRTSDRPEECPLDFQDASSPEIGWEDDIDPDNMTYEELLDLGEALGTQSRGLSKDLIKLLPTSRYKAGGFFSRKKSKERCVICLVTYKIGDQQMRLPCKHVYHSKCGRKWLTINKTCPVCNCEVFEDKPKD